MSGKVDMDSRNTRLASQLCVKAKNTYESKKQLEKGAYLTPDLVIGV